MLHNAYTHKYSIFFPPLNALSHMGWRQEYCREWAPRCQTPLSVFLSSHSAALQCFSAHAHTDWERATASLSSLEILTACIADTSTLQAVFLRCRNKSLVWRNWKFMPWLQFERLKMHRRGHVCCHESRTCDLLLYRAFICLKVTLPPTSFLHKLFNAEWTQWMQLYSIILPLFSQYSPSSITIITTML